MDNLVLLAANVLLGDPVDQGTLAVALLLDDGAPALAV